MSLTGNCMLVCCCGTAQLITEASLRIRKPTICRCENKGAHQLLSNCEADQRLWFRYMDSTIPLLLKSETSSFLPASVTVQADLCRTWSGPKLLVFSRTCSNTEVCKNPTTLRTYIKPSQVGQKPKKDLH